MNYAALYHCLSCAKASFFFVFLQRGAPSITMAVGRSRVGAQRNKTGVSDVIA